MAFSAAAVPLGLMFLISGFLVNILQVLALPLLLFSKKAYRVANFMLTDMMWSELIWLLEWWADVKVKLYTDPETLRLLGKEHALLICNHRSDIDWLVGWLLAKRAGCLGGTRAIMKQSVKYLPVIGWSMWFSEYVFLARNWAKDETTLKAGYRNLKGFPRPFWLALFVEGTRFTQTKLAAAQEYAASVGMPIPRNVLIPRTKGFVSAIENLRDFVPAVYDMSIAISNEAPEPNMSRILKGLPSVVHIKVKRIPMAELPTTDEGIANWCREAFVRKDKALDEHNKTNTFGDELYQPFERLWGPLWIVVGWAIVLLTGSIYLLRNVLSTWRGFLWVAGGLLLVAVVLEVLIAASQAERSKPLKVNKRPQVNQVKAEISENQQESTSEVKKEK
ncbi:unnamed protein product [Calypogeia fissa]